ncbi:Inositol-1-monophosphatase [hydrothermal vent metagenome]|uniref:inositol-phosphate phosphatase n=1 Tax=hydrothermal vent metagenome TaxID=652676 RepID=A0A3B0QTQ7_9ZZZZ
MEIMDAAIEMARKAGELLRGSLGAVDSVEFKGAVDIVTEMDKRAEALIVGAIKGRFPEHGILAEEGGEVVSTSPYRWIIDPLDGTTNYAHGFPFYCVSIGIEAHGVMEAGVVYAPAMDELFTAEKGKGAYLNGERIHVSKTAKLDTSLLATGFPYDIRTSKDNNLDHFGNFAVRSQAIRRAGAAAYDLCTVAAGRFDGFWEMKLRPWDIAAGLLMVEEAGGMVTDFGNAPVSLEQGEVLATSGLIHAEMLAVLNMSRPQAAAKP